jgi:cyclopropane fatty-acyl-phospholipid synthase-like methyltransferase
VSEAVGSFYDDMDRFYEAVWDGRLHAGLWTGPGDPSSLPVAQDRMTDLFVERVRLGPGQRLLDVGCGTGAPAARAARALDCRALGVTVSRAQVLRAAALARAEGLATRLAFLMADAQALPFGDAVFDGAWALESIFHVADRVAALREVRRVLRPGARLVLSDLVETRVLDARERGVTRALQIASLARPGHYPGWLAAAGLECVETLDLSAAVRRSVGETIRAADAREGELRSAYGQELYAAMRALLPELDALYAGKLGYLMVVARRPGP